MIAWHMSRHVSSPSQSPGSIHTWGSSTMEKPTSRWDSKVCHESPWIHTLQNDIARNILIISCTYLLAHNPKSELAPCPLKFRNSGMVFAGWLAIVPRQWLSKQANHLKKWISGYLSTQLAHSHPASHQDDTPPTSPDLKGRILPHTLQPSKLQK